MIIHIINKDKFTQAYIEFMLICMSEWEHRFFILEEKNSIGMENEPCVIHLSSWWDLRKRENKRILSAADQIIITGAFFVHIFDLIFQKKIWNKTYIQFWGGDFYDFNQSNKLQRRIRDMLKKAAFSRSNAFIFLINGEQKQFEKITGIAKKSFVAPVPCSPNETKSYHDIWTRTTWDHKTVLLGNSATPSNNHIEAITMLKKFKNYIKVYCPLSYGDSAYRDKVIRYGKQVLGDSFIPIVDFMQRNDYMEFLSQCDIGIFANNRQQALGNINRLLYLGKKVYLKCDTSMWNSFIDGGYQIYSIEEIPHIDITTFFGMDEPARSMNHSLQEAAFMQLDGIKQWETIFNDRVLNKDNVRGLTN